MRSISVSSRFWTASAAVLILFGASGALAEGVQVNVDVPPMVAESTGRVTTTVSLAPVSLDRTGDPLDPLIICTELLEQPPTDDSSDVSQDFEVSLDDYDSFGADDFSVPAGVAWEIVRITIFGAAPSGDPDNADDVRCAIFDNGTGNVPDGVPGDPALWSDEFEPGLAGYQQFGTRDLLLYPSTAPVLGAGTYWLSCWVRMSSDPFGQWYWEEATSSTGFTAQWINPGDGYGTGAVDWTDIQTLGSTADDMAFELCGSITTVTTTTTTTTIPGTTTLTMTRATMIRTTTPTTMRTMTSTTMRPTMTPRTTTWTTTRRMTTPLTTTPRTTMSPATTMTMMAADAAGVETIGVESAVEGTRVFVKDVNRRARSTHV
ncbi:MAG: hypothetical protein M5R36_28290 [Deltaproteobacteria bacterium]|nr:hypothetical protein [Deltaproteobacteria bacterium]